MEEKFMHEEQPGRPTNPEIGPQVVPQPEIKSPGISPSPEIIDAALEEIRKQERGEADRAEKIRRIKHPLN